MLILKQNAAASVPVPAAGKGTIFLSDSDVLSVKNSSNVVESFPTVGGSNTQVIFNDDAALSGSANYTFDKDTNILTVTGNVAATRVLTDNLLYANGVAWDLQQPAGSNTQVIFNDEGDFGANAAFTFDSVTGTLTTTKITTTGDAVIGGNLNVNGNLTYINVDSFEVEDPIIQMGGGPNGAVLSSNDGKDRGTALQYYDTSAKTAFMGWDNANAEFGFGSTVGITDEVVTFSQYGNIRADYFLGNGSSLTSITGANVTGEVAFATTANAVAGPNVSGAVNFASVANSVAFGNITGTVIATTVTTNAQPNITSTGTLTELTVTGNVGAGNVSGTGGVFTYVSGDGANLTNVTSGNITGQVANALVAGTVYTAAQPNITSVGTLTSLLAGADADINDFPNATFIAASDGAGYSGTAARIAVAAETTADSGNTSQMGVGVFGIAQANGGARGTGVFGYGAVVASADTGAATGVRGVADDTHSGGYNIGLLGAASGSSVDNYALYLQTGDIGTIENAHNWDLLDNNAGALTFSSTGKANIFLIETTNNAEGIATTGYLNVTGNITATAGLITDNLYYANGNPWDLQQPAGSNTEVIFNNAGDFGASSNFTFNTATNILAVTGAVNGTTLGGSLTTASQPNITSVGTLSGLSVTAPITGSITGSAGSATGSAATVTGAAQANITSVGTLTSLDVTGNVGAGNVSATEGAFTYVTGDGANLSAITGANVSGQVANALVAGTVYTNAQPNITSVGTLTSLDVTGNVSAGNISATAGDFTSVSGNGSALSAITGANVTGAVAFATTANAVAGANVSGQVANALVAGTVYTAAQPNITSVGTLSSVTTSGNVDTTANVVTDNIVGKTGGVTITAIGTNQPISLVTTGSGSVDVNSARITELGTPTAATDAATKAYVDSVAEGLHVHESCVAGTPGTLTSITGGTITYDNGTAGVGATLTTSSGNFDTIDGVSISTDDRVLVKNEVTTANNGIYVKTSSTVLTRATDFDTPTEMAGGDFVFIQQGSTLNDTGFVMTDAVTTIGTDPVTFVQFSGAGTFTAGAGLTLTGSEFSITNTAVSAASYGNGTHNATFTVNSRGQLTAAANVAITANAEVLTGTSINSSVVDSSLTSVGTLGSLSVTGNISAGNVSATAGAFTSVSGNGSALTALNASNISTGTLPSGRLSGTYTITVSGSATTAGTVTTAAQPNITSVGTLTSLSVTGNANVGNIGATSFVGSGASLTSLNGSNITSGTIAAARVATLNQNTTGYAATVSTAAQPNITSVGTLTSLGVTGTTTTGTLQSTTITTGSAATAGTITGDYTLTSGSTLNATYADLAEKYTADADYEPGTVVLFGGDAECTAMGSSANPAVAGIVTTNPAQVYNAECVAGEGEFVIELALIGRVPCKVIGPVHKGDLIVSSEMPGFGCKADPETVKPGTIIGKAISGYNGDTPDGVCEVLVGRC